MRRVCHDRAVAGLFVIAFMGLLAVAVTRSEWWRVTFTLRAMERRTIAQLGHGDRARVIGRVRPYGTVPSPIQLRPCVYWQVTIWIDGANVLTQQGGIPFFVDDSSGRVRVDPADAQVSLVDDAEGDIDTRVAAFVAQCGLVPRAGMRFREATITAGETVAVWGASVREPDPTGTGGGYREAPTGLRISAWRDVPLLISDRPATTE